MGAYQVDNSYYELADHSIAAKVSSEELIGAPNCPCCGNQYGLAVCSCQKIHCIGEEEISTCPWCGMQGRYTSGNGGGFDISRAQG